MARTFNFEFELGAPITRDEVSAWHARDGIADEDAVPFEPADGGTYIAFRGDHSATAAQNITTYLPRFHAWLIERDIAIFFLRGDFLPPGFWRRNPFDEW